MCACGCLGWCNTRGIYSGYIINVIQANELLSHRLRHFSIDGTDALTVYFLAVLGSHYSYLNIYFGKYDSTTPHKYYCFFFIINLFTESWKKFFMAKNYFKWKVVCWDSSLFILLSHQVANWRVYIRMIWNQTRVPYEIWNDIIFAFFSLIKIQKYHFYSEFALNQCRKWIVKL